MRKSLAIALARVLLISVVYFVRRRRVPYSLVGMDVIHARTNGRLDGWLSRAVVAVENRLSRPAPFAADRSPIFTEPVDPHVEALRRDGMTVLASRLPDEMVARLVRHFGEEDQTIVEDGPIGTGRYPDGTPGAQFKIDQSAAFRSEDLQLLACDPLLAEIARRYFGATPVVSYGAMWWNTVRTGAAPDYLAQRYHWDNAGLQWLHVFVYLSDVDEGCGPHTYVRGSHRPETARGPLVAKGTVRLGNGEVEQSFPGRAFAICGASGTVLLVDTWGLHKAGQPTRRDRLVIDLMFNNSLLGVNTVPPDVIPSDRLLAAAAESPRTFSWMLQHQRSPAPRTEERQCRSPSDLSVALEPIASGDERAD